MLTHFKAIESVKMRSKCSKRKYDREKDRPWSIPAGEKNGPTWSIYTPAYRLTCQTTNLQICLPTFLPTALLISLPANLAKTCKPSCLICLVVYMGQITTCLPAYEQTYLLAYLLTYLSAYLPTWWGKSWSWSYLSPAKLELGNNFDEFWHNWN